MHGVNRTTLGRYINIIQNKELALNESFEQKFDKKKVNTN